MKQGSMSVCEYRDKFIQLSRYATYEVDTDAKRQHRFLEGLIGPLNYQLHIHTFPDLQTMINKAIGLESKRKDFGEQKRKSLSQGQSSNSNTRPRYNNQQSSQFRSGGYQQMQRQQPQHFNQ